MSTLFDWVELPSHTEVLLPVVTSVADDSDQLVTKNTGGTEPLLPVVTSCYQKKYNTCGKSVCVCKIENFTHAHDESIGGMFFPVTTGNSGNKSENYTCRPTQNAGNNGGNSGNRLVTTDHTHVTTIAIAANHPLHMPTNGDYRRWLWTMMQPEQQDNAALWDCLMEIANLVWTEQSFRIDYQYADVILSAVKKYVIGDMKQH